MKMEHLNNIKNESANFILKDFLPIPQYAVTLLSASGGVGKAIYINENVLTPSGWKTMKDLKLNDYVIGSDGKQTKVIGVYPQGIRESYRVTFVDGTDVVCDGDHLWTVKSSSRKGGTFTVNQILEKGYSRDKFDKRYGTTQTEYFYGIPLCKNGYEFGNDDSLKLNPYLLGLLLGDGSFRKNSISFTNSNKVILNKILELLPKEDTMTIKKVNNTYECIIRRKERNNEISETSKIIKYLGLFGLKSSEKFIPIIYKNASLKSRKEIIQGLIDTDGYINPKNKNLDEYSTSSKLLADDFLEVGRSVGMMLTIKDRIPKFKYKGECKDGERNYRIYNKNQSNKKIVNIEKLDNKEMVCIKVDSEDELFVVNGFNLTHNTRLSLIMADRFIQKENKNVALWLTEDYPGQVRAIFDDMIKDNLVTPSSMEKMIIILEEPPQLALRVNGLFKANYEEIKKIGEHLVKQNVHFAVFDPLLAFYGGNENDNSEARVFIQAFAEWAKVAKITTLIIHHANKDGASRGATAFHDGVRARYELSVPTNDEGVPNKESVAKGLRLATLRKDNWGIRKYLWKITDGEDSILIKVAPELRNEYKSEPEITTFEDTEEQNNDNDFLGSMF